MSDASIYLKDFFGLPETVDLTAGTTLFDCFRYYNKFCLDQINDSVTFQELVDMGLSIGDVEGLTVNFAEFLLENPTMETDFNEYIDNGVFYGVIVNQILSLL